MKPASKWASDLRVTMGLAIRQPEPLLGSGKSVLEATIEQVQLDVLDDLRHEALQCKSPWIEQCINYRTQKLRKGAFPVDKVQEAA